MRARQQLAEAYDSWEQWTRREGVAIREGNWGRVRECQSAKLELQGRIPGLVAAANAACVAAGLDPQVFEPHHRRIVNDLVALEIRNAGLLADRCQAATAQLAELDHAGRNLKRVQKYYGQPSRVAWHSYS
jgi:hypothetical protein